MLSLFVPAVIFVPGQWLMVFAMVFFYGTWYLVDCFCDYVKSSIPHKVAESEEVRVKSEEFAAADSDGNGAGTGLADEQQERMEYAVAKWTAQGGHRKSGLNKSMVAGQMGVSVNLLSQWLRHRNQNFWDWLSNLRIEEAKRIISEHPDWTNEAIAEHCGFTDRSAFQNKFKEKTGMTPTEFAQTAVAQDRS